MDSLNFYEIPLKKKVPFEEKYPKVLELFRMVYEKLKMCAEGIKEDRKRIKKLEEDFEKIKKGKFVLE